MSPKPSGSLRPPSGLRTFCASSPATPSATPPPEDEEEEEHEEKDNKDDITESKRELDDAPALCDEDEEPKASEAWSLWGVVCGVGHGLAIGWHRAAREDGVHREHLGAGRGIGRGFRFGRVPRSAALRDLGHVRRRLEVVAGGAETG